MGKNLLFEKYTESNHHRKIHHIYYLKDVWKISFCYRVTVTVGFIYIDISTVYIYLLKYHSLIIPDVAKIFYWITATFRFIHIDVSTVNLRFIDISKYHSLISEIAKNIFYWVTVTYKFIQIDISTVALKVVSAMFLLFCKSKKEHLQSKEKCFISLQKLFSNSNFPDIQVSWSHQMQCLILKHDTFY